MLATATGRQILVMLLAPHHQHRLLQNPQIITGDSLDYHNIFNSLQYAEVDSEQQ